MNCRSSTPKIVVTHPIHDQVLGRLEAVGRVDMNPSTEPWGPKQLQARLADAEGMMAFMTDCVDAQLLAHAPRLRIVACALKGFDNFDVAACTTAGAWVSIVPDLLTEPTAELAIGLAIALARNVRAGDAWVRTGQFQGWRPTFYGMGLAGATVAVIGLGQVGQAIIERLSGFGCTRIIGVDPAVAGAGKSIGSAVRLEDALALSDFIFLAAPLTPDSLHMINAESLQSCQRKPFLINVGRGSVVDEEAVADALEHGHLSGYAADVFACEDRGLNQRPDRIADRLLTSGRTVLTPHLGSAVTAVRLAIEHRAADNLIAVLQGGEPRDAINRPLLATVRHSARSAAGNPLSNTLCPPPCLSGRDAEHHVAGLDQRRRRRTEPEAEFENSVVGDD